jgi:hypothetical protein
LAQLTPAAAALFFYSSLSTHWRLFLPPEFTDTGAVSHEKTQLGPCAASRFDASIDPLPAMRRRTGPFVRPVIRRNGDEPGSEVGR